MPICRANPITEPSLSTPDPYHHRSSRVPPWWHGSTGWGDAGSAVYHHHHHLPDAIESIDWADLFHLGEFGWVCAWVVSWKILASQWWRFVAICIHVFPIKWSQGATECWICQHVSLFIGFRASYEDCLKPNGLCCLTKYRGPRRHGLLGSHDGVASV